MSHYHHRCQLKVPDDVTERPHQAVIAHRGASYNMPEHSLEAYRLAMEQGADYIEIDLVLTSDGEFVAMHSMDLEATTDVETAFPDRTSYKVYEYTWAELQQLRLKQRVPGARTEAMDGQFKIPSLPQILELWKTWNTELMPMVSKATRRVGLYVEVKDPKTLEEKVSLSNGNTVAEDLIEHLYLSDAHATVPLVDTDCDELKVEQYLVPQLVMENFHGEFMEEVYDKWTSRYNITDQHPPPMVLLTEREYCTDEEYWYQMDKWTTFLTGIAPDKECLMPGSSAGGEDENDKWVNYMDRAKEYELAVHPWTERPEFKFVDDPFTTLQEEMEHLICIVGVDGLFVEDITAARVLFEKGCPDDDNDNGEGETPAVEQTPVPTAAPTAAETTATASLPATSEAAEGTSDNQECYSRDDTLMMAMAAGLMGFFIGCIMTYWVSQSRVCRSRRHRSLQLRVPTHEDIEMI